MTNQTDAIKRCYRDAQLSRKDNLPFDLRDAQEIHESLDELEDDANPNSSGLRLIHFAPLLEVERGRICAPGIAVACSLQEQRLCPLQNVKN